ncbi:MAG: ferredoxin [Rhodospirillaceae bacterium]|nr:MAG: ferredoxin [Rhodospirillaceae bacterium]
MSNIPSKPKPFFDLHVFCCTNVRRKDHPLGSCGAKGSIQLRQYMKDRSKELGLKMVRINSAGCLTRCKLGPVIVVYPDETWYAVKTKADIDEILDVHIQKGGRVERLRLDPDQ